MTHAEGMQVDEVGFTNALEVHRQLSRNASENKFQGGLLDHGFQTTRLHTATHLLHQALRKALGDHVHQMGSNITSDRLRFDFSHPKRLTPEQIENVERLVNEQIAQDLPVTMDVLSLDAAMADGALAFFREKYGQQVKVYTIGEFSKEVCGGPHVASTALLGKFKITKEEAVGQGTRRIRAILLDNIS
jgi:alanyl-tRNA synthetase